jgi:hypothetical protein
MAERMSSVWAGFDLPAGLVGAAGVQSNNADNSAVLRPLDITSKDIDKNGMENDNPHSSSKVAFIGVGVVCHPGAELHDRHFHLSQRNQ